MTLSEQLRDIVLYNRNLTDSQVSAILGAADALDQAEVEA